MAGTVSPTCKTTWEGLAGPERGECANNKASHIACPSFPRMRTLPVLYSPALGVIAAMQGAGEAAGMRAVCGWRTCLTFPGWPADVLEETDWYTHLSVTGSTATAKRQGVLAVNG